MVENDQDYAVMMLNTDGVIISWNKGAEIISGYKAEEVLGQHFGIFYPAEERENEVPAQYLQKALTNGSIKHEDWRVKKDGTKIWVNIKLSALRNAENELVGFYKVVTDLTEFRTLTLQRDRTQEILDDINQTARIGTWEVNLEKGTSLWSRITREIHELDESYQITPEKGILFYKEGESRDLITHVFNEAIAHGKPYDIEVLIVTATGREVWCRTIGQAEIKDGKCVRVYGTFQDIDHYKRTQIELALSEEQFRRSFDLSGIGMALVDPDAIPIRVNKRLCDILGYTPEEFYAMNVLEITHPDDIAEDVANARKLLNGEIDHYQMVKRYIHSNGSIIWSHITVSLVRDSNKRPLHFVSEIEDITEQKHAEDELKRINSELTAMFNSGALVSIISADLNGVITHFNKGAEMMLGYSAEEVIGKASPMLMHKPEELNERGKRLSKKMGVELKGVDILRANAKKTGSDSGEWTYVRKDGTTLPVQLVISSVRDENNNVTGYLGIATDITQIKEAEAALRKYALLEAKNKEMEQFTFIASHDLLEPLQTVSSFVELLKEEYHGKLNADASKYIEFISGSTRRMMELVKGLLHYSRLGRERHREKADCNVLLQDVIDDLGLQIADSNATLKISPLPTIDVYTLEFKQLFQNLLTNAIKFRQEGRPLVIEISASQQNNNWTFVVRDNGIGIADRNKEKVFAIFQRLHDRHEFSGTGIGLSYCKKIVELHKGNIWVESVPGEGSSFYFTIMTQTS